MSVKKVEETDINISIMPIPIRPNILTLYEQVNG